MFAQSNMTKEQGFPSDQEQKINEIFPNSITKKKTLDPTLNPPEKKNKPLTL